MSLAVATKVKPSPSSRTTTSSVGRPPWCRRPTWCHPPRRTPARRVKQDLLILALVRLDPRGRSICRRCRGSRAAVGPGKHLPCHHSKERLPQRAQRLNLPGWRRALRLCLDAAKGRDGRRTWHSCAARRARLLGARGRATLSRAPGPSPSRSIRASGSAASHVRPSARSWRWRSAVAWTASWGVLYSRDFPSTWSEGEGMSAERSELSVPPDTAAAGDAPSWTAPTGSAARPPAADLAGQKDPLGAARPLPPHCRRACRA